MVPYGQFGEKEKEAEEKEKDLAEDGHCTMSRGIYDRACCRKQ